LALPASARIVVMVIQSGVFDREYMVTTSGTEKAFPEMFARMPNALKKAMSLEAESVQPFAT